MEIWFTSDTHFNHANIIQHSKRPFESAEEMEEALVRNWNLLVSGGDIIFHLGDFALSWGSKHAETIDRVLSRLRGQKVLIIGNHDRKEVTANKRWGDVRQLHEIKIGMGGEHKQRIVLCHYAMRTWNQMHRGAWMLHGHSHGNLPYIGGKTMDVGVDCNKFRPIHISDVQKIMETRDIIHVDHH